MSGLLYKKITRVALTADTPPVSPSAQEVKRQFLGMTRPPTAKVQQRISSFFFKFKFWSELSSAEFRFGDEASEVGVSLDSGANFGVSKLSDRGLDIGLYGDAGTT